MWTNNDFINTVKQFEKAKDSKDDSLNMHYFLTKYNDEVLLHRFKDRKEKSDIRSISKTIMTLLTGIVQRLSEEGKYNRIDEDTYIYPILKNVITLTNKKNEKYLKKVQIRHLLTHTVGFDKVLLMREDIEGMDPNDYLNFVVNSPIVYEPGTYYLYSNAGFYLLSAFLQEFLQEDLLDFAEREFFEPLEIEDFYWEKYGKYLAGATRLWLYPEDLLKIGELFLNKGKYKNKRIVENEWLEKMTTVRIRTEGVDTPGATFRRYGYGYGIWCAKEGFYFGHGTDGQTLTMLPDYNFIMLTQANQSDVEKLEDILNDAVLQITNPELSNKGEI